MNKDCPFCNDAFVEESIKRYDSWDVQLYRDDQYYIGRTVAAFKNRHITDIRELESSEREELFETVLPELQNSLDNIYSPDLYNYSKIGNDCQHLHLHIIPRFKTPRYFNDKKFEDEYWNQTYSQEYKRVRLSEDERDELRGMIRDNMC